MNLFVKFLLLGVLMNSLCSVGMVGNLATLFILNCNQEMRSQPINVYLSFLAFHDSGVLAGAIAIWGIPNLRKLIDYFEHVSILEQQEKDGDEDEDYEFDFANVWNYSDNKSIIYEKKKFMSGIYLKKQIADSVSLVPSSITNNSITKQKIEMNMKARKSNEMSKREQEYPPEMNIYETDEQIEDEMKTSRSRRNGNQVQEKGGEGKRKRKKKKDNNITQKVEKDKYNLYGKQNPSAFYITLVYPVALMTQTASIWLTCLITVERYIAIVHPLRSLILSTRKRAWITSLIVTLAAVLFNFSKCFELTVELDPQTGLWDINPTALRTDETYKFVYYVIIVTVFVYVGPYLLLIYLNCKIYRTIKDSNIDRRNLTSVQKSELKLTSMLVLLVTVFIVCNTSALITNFMEILKVKHEIMEVMLIITNLTACLNSSVNFIIYCLYGHKFRKTFYSKFSFLCSCFKLCSKTRSSNLAPTSSPAITYNNISRVGATQHSQVAIDEPEELQMINLKPDDNFPGKQLEESSPCKQLVESV